MGFNSGFKGLIINLSSTAPFFCRCPKKRSSQRLRMDSCCYVRWSCLSWRGEKRKTLYYSMLYSLLSVSLNNAQEKGRNVRM